MAGFLNRLAGNLLGKISEAARRPEFCRIRRELRNLETTISNIKVVLRDAEEKQASNLLLNDLLKQLKDVFSMADDLIEELECKYLECKVQNRKNDGDQMVHPLSSCFSSNFLVSSSKSAAEINQITKELDDIEEAMYKFRLVEDENEHIKRLKTEMTLRTSITGSQVFSRVLHLKKEAILSDNVDSIIGRDEAKQSIIDKLVEDGDDKQKYKAIFSIHGDGGMGKTALAKLVYNAHQVFDHFDKRMWVCVSEDFDFERIRRAILSSATGENVTNALTAQRLLIRLQRNLDGRRFLLVLDDFGAIDLGRVIELENIIKMGANGSKILITTRHSEENLNDSTTHKIERLDEEKSMVLFKHIFENKKQNEKYLRIESEVKEELVPKCGGTPLAIKCVAGLLSSEVSDGVERLNVKELSEKWLQEEAKDGCVSIALRLSYDLMPSYLKPCFICFSLLPKDYVFYSFELIQLWMAQGILHSVSEDSEAVGEQYFNELWSRGLLEDVEEHALGYWFKINNLVHDLAVEQANKEQRSLESLNQLSFLDSNIKNLSPSTIDKIHFLSIPVGGVEPKLNRVPLVKSIGKFRHLRLLYLCNSSLEEIPTRIDTLKHLRYLDLRGNQRLKRLPESMCKLHSLQTLILAFCTELEELPKNIKNMISLRFLWIQTKQAILGKDGIGSLTSLRFLAIGGSENLTHLFEDIEKLNFLRTLMIYDCKSLLSLPKGLKNTSTLRNLAIWGCEQLRFTFSLKMIGLKKLILRGFPALSTLPRWINYLDENLEVLEVGEFPRLRVLPEWLSDFWELRIFGISNCPRLEDCMPNDLDYCDKMNELRITFCGSLSTKSMEQKNHEELNISHISNIYVDSKKIRSRLTLTDEHMSEGTAEKTEEVKHKVGNLHEVPPTTVRATPDEANKDSPVGTDQTVRAKHDGTSHHSHGAGLVGLQHDGTRGDSHVDPGLFGRKPGDGNSDNGHVDAGLVKAKHDGTSDNNHVDEELVGAKHDDGSSDNSHVDAEPVGAKHEKTSGNSHVDAHLVGAKHDDRTSDNSNVDAEPVGAKHEKTNGESHADAHLLGAKHDDRTSDNSHVDAGPDGAKHEKTSGDSHADAHLVGAKHDDDGTSDNSHVDVRPDVAKHEKTSVDSHVDAHLVGPNHDNGTSDNNHVDAEPFGAKDEKTSGDSHADAHLVRAKHDNGTSDNSHVDAGPNGAKHEKISGDNHVDAHLVGAKHDDGSSNNSHVHAGLVGAKHEKISSDSHAYAHLVGVNRDDGTSDNSHVDVQPVGAKHEKTSCDSHVDAHLVGAKHDDRTSDNSHVDHGLVGAKHDKTSGDSHANARLVGAKHERNSGDSHVDAGLVGGKHDGTSGDSHINVGLVRAKDEKTSDDSQVDAELTGGKHDDGTIDDSHVDARLVEAKHDGKTNNNHFEDGKIEGAKLGGANDHGHAMVCLGEHDNVGDEPAEVVTTFEGF